MNFHQQKEASRNDLVQKWFSHSNGTTLSPSHSLSANPSQYETFAKSFCRLNEHLPKVTQNYPLRANWRGQIPRRNNKRRLESVCSFLNTPHSSCVQIRLEAHFVVLHSSWGEGGGGAFARIIRTFLWRGNTVCCMANFIVSLFCVYRSSALYCALWLCKMQSSGWANLRRCALPMLLYLLHRDLYAPDKVHVLLLIVKIEQRSSLLLCIMPKEFRVANKAQMLPGVKFQQHSAR